MRSVKFRGKSVADGQWVYGCIVNNLWVKSELTSTPGVPICEIIPDQGEEATDWSEVEYKAVEVIPETVGQDTGITATQGESIFEDDIVRVLYTDWPSKSQDDPRTLDKYLEDLSSVGRIMFRDDRWAVGVPSRIYPDEYSYHSIYPGPHGFIKIIGDFHNHSELLSK